MRYKKQLCKLTVCSLLILSGLFACGLSAGAKSIPFGTRRTLIHAGGIINGYTVTNSKNALYNALKAGNRNIELDFKITKDGQLVCVHSWKEMGFKKIPTKRQFLKRRTKGGFLSMDAAYALRLLSRYHAYLIVDAKAGESVKVYKKLDKLCDSIGLSSYKEMIIPQIYKGKDYYKLRKIYNYRNWVFTTYRLKNYKAKEYAKVAGFCKIHNIKVVAIPVRNAQPWLIKLFRNNKIDVAVHTINSSQKAKELRQAGVSIIYSDTLGLQ